MVIDNFTNRGIPNATSQAPKRITFTRSCTTGTTNGALEILKNIRPAMKPGYSKVLVNELMVPDRNPHWAAMSMGFLMMVLGGMRERSSKEWYGLFEKVGFKVAGQWECEPGTEWVFELE